MPVWDGDNQTELFKTLERQHCHAARIIFGFPPDMPPVEVLATVKWNTLTSMYKRSLIKLFLKGYHGMLLSSKAEELIIHGGSNPQVTGRRSQVTGCRSQVAGRRSQVAGRRSQVAGRRSQVAGRRSQVAGRRSHAANNR